MFPGPVESIPVTRYEAVAEIVIGGAELEAEGRGAYDARDVISNLGPKIVPAPG